MSQAIVTRIDTLLAALDADLAALQTETAARAATIKQSQERLHRARLILLDPQTSRLLQACADAGIEVRV